MSKRSKTRPKTRTKPATRRDTSPSKTPAKAAETPLFEYPPPKPGEAMLRFRGTLSQMEAAVDYIRAERPKTEPTFTLEEVHRMVGDNYSMADEGDMADPMSFAIDAFDDIVRTTRVCIEALPVTNDTSTIDPVSCLLTQVWHRAETIGNMLNKIRLSGKKPAVQS